MKNYYDVIVIGSGVAGLSCALELDPKYKVCLISKKKIEEANSYLAQGGISARRMDEALIDYIEDTLRAGHYRNDVDVVEKILTGSLDVVNKMVDYGVSFDKINGVYSLHKEGGHKRPRVYHVGDYTGRAICESMAKIAKVRENIDICEDVTFYDLIIEENKVVGIKVFTQEEYRNVYSSAVVLATGGIGGIFDSSTNYKTISGDGLSIAIKNNIDIKNLEYIQIHPTVLYSEKGGRQSLITEALRGEGGILLDSRGNRFVDELLPRDVVSKAIREKMSEEGTNFVYMSLENVKDRKHIDETFPTVFDSCIKEGIDIRKDMIPICPGQHYHMGGISAKIDGSTNIDGLYAVGEVACTGFHGKNRLASNSLLEAGFCGMRSAQTINLKELRFKGTLKENLESKNIEGVINSYHDILINEIKERNLKFYEYWLKTKNA